MRIGKKGAEIVQNTENLGIGKANLLAKGQKILVFGIGPIISEA